MSTTGAVVSARTPRRQPRQKAWRPLLLHQPSGLVRARGDWQPVTLRRRRVETVTVLIAFLALQFLIPARLVIGGLGAIGRPAVAVGVLLAFLWLLSLVRNGQLPAGSQPIRWVIGGFVLLQLIGYVVGFDRGLPALEASAADRWMIYVVAMAGLALAVTDGIANRRQLDRFLLWMVGLTAVMAFIGALQFLGVDLVQYIRIPGLQANEALIGIGERGGPGFARIASTAGHYIEFGVVLALILPIALHYALFSTPGRRRVFLWIAVALIATGIPLSISRSATLAVGLVMALVAVVWPWRQRYNALIIGLVATAAFQVLQPGVLGTIKALFVHADDDPSVQDRIARTGYVMDLWSLRPWLGRGAGTVIPEQYILLDNQIYATLLAGGVVGVAGLVLFFLVPYFVGRSIRLRAADQETRHLGHILAITLPVALVVSATFDSFSFATFTGVVFAVIGAIGALWRIENMTVRRPLQPAAPGDRYVTTPLMATWRRDRGWVRARRRLSAR